MADLAQTKRQHQQEVITFLQTHVSHRPWQLTLPEGTGHETYIAHNSDRGYFIKLGAQAAKYKAMASIGLSPQVLVEGFLGDSTSIIVQPYIEGKKPSQKDYRLHLELFAAAINKMHHSPEVRQVLPAVLSDLYREAGLESLFRIQHRWERYKTTVPEVAGFIDESLAHLQQQVMAFQGSGLVASHNDICNANWLITPAGQLYLVDLESMSHDDPALDIGATLWWYYPPGLWQDFLIIVGHDNDEAFQNRMQVRMAMHCLSITLPREQSFDRFDPASFAESLADFRAILVGKGNPKGYKE
jgi:thiamine kinase-like enzyme